jgi:hypothetical protein
LLVQANRQKRKKTGSEVEGLYEASQKPEGTFPPKYNLHGFKNNIKFT